MARLCTKTVREPLCSLNGTALPDSKMPTFGENERRFNPGLPRKAKLMFSAAQAWRVPLRREARCGPGLRRDLGRRWPCAARDIARIRRRACGSMRPLSMAALSPSSASRMPRPRTAALRRRRTGSSSPCSSRSASMPPSPAAAAWRSPPGRGSSAALSTVKPAAPGLRAAAWLCNRYPVVDAHDGPSWLRRHSCDHG